MLKYVDARVVFQEVPDEITLAINISNCPCHCKGCHSSYLAEDIGTKLTFEELLRLYSRNAGVTCISFMGGDSDPAYINKLAEVLKEGELPVRTAWYSGRQELDKNINLENFGYIKLGPYIEELGPLSNKLTNQRFYKVIRLGEILDENPAYHLEDITYKFWKN